MKVLLIGADGQLGSDIARIFRLDEQIQLVPLTLKDVDITDFSAVRNVFGAHNPDVVVNTAAYIQVDQSETEMEQAFFLNASAVGNLCDVCQSADAVFVHFSTDYVFSGTQSEPYVESDVPQPINIYGISKLAGEQIIRYRWQKHFILRVCGLYGTAGPMGKSGNFVDAIVQKAEKGDVIRVVDDQRLTPTFTLSVAESLPALLQSKAYGLYHMTDTGDCSWFEFAEEIVRQCGFHDEIERAKTGDFGEAARRPAYSVLDNLKMKSLGLADLPYWKDSLRRYLEMKYPELVDT